MDYARPYNHLDAQQLAVGEQQTVWLRNPDTNTYDPATIKASTRSTAITPTHVLADARTIFGASHTIALPTTPTHPTAPRALTINDLKIPTDPDYPTAGPIPTSPTVGTQIHLVAFVDDTAPDTPTRALDALTREFPTARIRKLQSRPLPDQWVTITDHDGTVIAPHVLAAEAPYLTPPTATTHPTRRP